MERPRPELKKYLEKTIVVKINGNRCITGVLRGYDEYLNLVLDNSYDITNAKTEADKLKLPIGVIMIRGNSIVSLETLNQ